ncbi:hypothetical protein [Seonamhaeicola marinus]|uniref:Uncharacterized protein n=1 Tax=Seonamhaeicola marinus TaxID=1912246 RepID=A0A5D0HJM2_9FLAO|nr:hypothetical protein [Seonamhaeicola marinus]TYA71488.1 hypothetical protein FUA24_18075 [Seonamhaeicola marinus]
MPKLLVGIILIVYSLFVILGFTGYGDLAFTFDSLIIPLVAISYFAFVKKRTFFFSLFVICYAVSELMGLTVSYLLASGANDFIQSVDFYTGNSLYILAYFFLFIEVIRNIDFNEIFKSFKIHLIVLIALNIWLVYVLQLIVVTKVFTTSDYVFELVYNIVMLVLLAASLLNYFCRDNQKSLYLFLGALCIVFSEVIDVAYIYITQRSLLNFLSTTLSLGAFYFFYIQTEMADIKEDEIRII